MNTTRNLAALAVLLMASTGPASAATVIRQHFANGGSACTGALPTYEGALRKRPKAITNEGDTNAFVTCALPADSASTARPTLVTVRGGNSSAVVRTLRCTLVNGSEGDAGTTSYPFAFDIQPNGTLTGNYGSNQPDGQFAFRAVAVSCVLEPGVSILTFGYRIAEEVGN